MMHELEKSDPFIQAKKLVANKQGQSSAEPAERREGTKGNSGEDPHAPDTEPGECALRDLTGYGR